jgi:predicted Fe-Mo cluster-binding NifX family protein
MGEIEADLSFGTVADELKGRCKMRIAISSKGPDLGANVDPKFGRCAYFVLVDTDSMEFEPVENTAAYVSVGAGVPAARLVMSHGAEAVMTGEIGPAAWEVLSDAHIRVFVRAHGSLREAIQGVNEGKYPRSFRSTVTPGFGISDQGTPT